MGKKIGTVSYNKYANFTNYGSALQTWALIQAIKRTGNTPIMVDYCPDILLDKDILNPFANMWDQDVISRMNCELSLPAIKENYYKFEHFYNKTCPITAKKYTSSNFSEVLNDEKFDGFVCGSDSIFCIDEFSGFDNGYYANFDCMKGKSVSYAASFGSAVFDESSYPILNERLKNFKALGIRENRMIEYIRNHVSVPCSRTIDPTLLLSANDYDVITENKQYEEPYILLYSRRYNPEMEAYAELIAKERGLKIVEISLRATNRDKGHIMRYDAGVEEFLSLVKYSDFVVTNSFHGLIFSVQFRKPFGVFTRSQAINKTEELLELFGISNHLVHNINDANFDFDYDQVHKNIEKARNVSYEFLKNELDLL